MKSPTLVPTTLALIVLAGCATVDTTAVSNFEECVAAGNPVMESMPRQCRHGEELFVEEIDVEEPENEDNELINLESPKPNDIITSPVTVKGEARGTWYFEASFPVKLLDSAGNEIAVAPAQAQGEWMTEDFVPFELSLTFQAPPTPFGMLVLEKDNPSGLPENADSIRIPVRFR